MFDWAGYLALATELSGSADEARKRTAISRAYYSAFHFARDHLRAEDPALVPPPTGSVHKWVWDKMGARSTTEERVAGANGRRLLGYRTRADYDAEYPGSLEKELAFALRVADKIRAVLKR